MVKSCCAYGCTNSFRKNVDAKNKISFHHFPKDPETRKKWILATKWKNFNPNEHTYICSVHFKFEDYYPRYASGLRKLRENVVPSIFDFPEHLQNPEKKIRKRRPETPPGPSTLTREATPSISSPDLTPEKLKFESQLHKTRVNLTQVGKKLKYYKQKSERLKERQCCVLGCEAVKTDIDHGSGLRFFGFPEERTVKNRWIEAIQRTDFDPNVHKAVCSQHFVESDYVIQQGSDEKRLKVRAVPSIFPLQRQPSMGGAEDDVFNIIYDMNPADYDTSDQDQDFEVPEIISDDCIISQASETISEDYSMCQAPETRSQDYIQLSKNQFKLVGKTRDQGTQTSCKDSAKLKLYRCKVKSLLQSVRRKDKRIKQMEEEIALMKEKIKSFKLSNLKLQALNNME
ncbi:peroxynitrite isomerase THAP4 isoform X2 [Nilaparvata lugens]|uniref:peroxynitrite isomerase THAP4 isoform X2 n=1 Tax=Nilaparvata lugens TaxID=108931 RepID=UPI00193C9BAD|nr:peroxynitrite isomerase THAP4 isoform X2 [Nilaparvata lugens]